jgi:hypothetical protein
MEGERDADDCIGDKDAGDAGDRPGLEGGAAESEGEKPTPANKVK